MTFQNDLPSRKEHPVAQVPTPPAPIVPAVPGQQEILRKIAAAPTGSLTIISTIHGTDFKINNESVSADCSARDLAFLQGAVRELQRKGFIELVNKSESFEQYKMTAQGYTAADSE